MSPLSGWARIHPHTATRLRLSLSLVLLALVGFEGFVLAGRPSVPHAAVWASGAPDAPHPSAMARSAARCRS
ncbi:hypothetical protein ACWGE1_29475 [Streptomyces sp. NPDC054932]